MGIVELVDANEEENCYIASEIKNLTQNILMLKYFYPSILGVGASIIPYPEHNQSPRIHTKVLWLNKALGFQPLL